MQLSDTIFACCSSAMPAQRGIVRLSGDRAFEVAGQFCAELDRSAGVGDVRFHFDGMTVPGRAYRFLAPHSYTGQDIVELHLPGNPLLIQMLLQAIAATGNARPAEAGEFTARAYFNGRLNLAQAEGVALAIAANSQREAHAARKLLAGELTTRLEPIIEELVQTLALIEAGIDFSEEDISFLSQSTLIQRLETAMGMLRKLLSGSVRFESLAREPSIVLVGRPNAGKSTLLNALCGQQRAVVSNVAGTTRDAIWSTARLPRGSVRVNDTAGLDESGKADAADAADVVADQMRRSAERAVEEADVLVLVIDGTDHRAQLNLPRQPDLIVATKSDLPGMVTGVGELVVSAVTGAGMVELIRRIDEISFGGEAGGADALALSARHVSAIDSSLDSLSRAHQRASHPGGDELIALELRDAVDFLGSIAGQVTPDDVLGRIFSKFCIGK